MKKFVLLILIPLFLGPLFSSFLCVTEVSASNSETFYYKYLIIVPDNESWFSTLQPFVEWKTREGLQYFSGFPANCIPVKVTNLTEISNSYGSANASSIRNYIKDFWEANSYAEHTSTLKYVLLVGDVKHIPSYLYNTTVNGDYCTYATDQYYADFYYPALDEYIDPTVNKTDWRAEVYVGRFPVNNPEELANVVNKTVTYEMYANGLQQNLPGWERRILFLGAILNNGHTVDSTVAWKDGAFVAECINQNVTDWWMDLPDPTTLYDTNDNTTIWPSEYQYLNYLHNLTYTNVINQISNIGFSAVLSVSHGNLNSLSGMKSGSPGSWNMPFFNSASVSSLNNSYILPFWFAEACNTGAFQADLWRSGEKCLGEELLLVDPSSVGGVVGYIGSSNASWYTLNLEAPQNSPGVLETLSDRLANLTFYELYSVSSPLDYSPSKWTLGAALFEAKRLYNETSWDTLPPGTEVPAEIHMATCLGFNLLGDPSLQIWPETPLDATSFYNVSSPTTVRAGANFAVHVEVEAFFAGGSYPPLGPREDAKVCISGTHDDGTVWCSVNLTDVNGNATFTAPVQPGIYNLTVTDHPYLMPYLSQILVVVPDHDVAIENVTVSETVVEQGFSLMVNVTAENYGGYSETFNVTLYANDTLVDAQNITLAVQESTTIIFLWNTTSAVLGNYTIKAEATQVVNETDTLNNTYILSYVINVIPEFPKTSILLLVTFSSSALLLALKKRKRKRTSTSFSG